MKYSLAGIRSFLELPLLKRELIELAQKKRTYVLRSICLVIFGLVFLTVYFEATNRSSSIFRLLGSGLEMNMSLLISSLVAIFALAPAMSCAAISSEMEKQTLGILLISKLSPGKIVVEKIFSRMLPLLSLVTVVAPLLAIGYLFGGTTVQQLFWGIYILFFVVFQTTSVSVFCSAVFRKSQAAFWMTYIILLVWYFSWPLLSEMTHWFEFNPLASLPSEEFMFFPVYQAVMLLNEASTWQDYALLTLPQILLTLCFPLLTWRSLQGYVEGAPVNFLTFPRRVASFFITRLRRFRLGCWITDRTQWLSALRERWKRLKLDVRRSVRTFLGSNPSSEPASHSESETAASRVETLSVADAAIAWRESRTGLFAKFPVIKVSVVALLFLQWLSVKSSGGSYHNSEDVCACFSFGLLIAWLLLVLGQSCRIFAGERERQTLSILLATPISNADLLNQKLSVVHATIQKGTWLILIPCFFNMATTDFHQTSRLTYLLCTLGNAFIYMHLVKWTGTYFGLRTNTQMKAMVSSLVTVLVFCFLPLLLFLVWKIGLGERPNQSALFPFISPLIMSALNEFHEVWRAVESISLPNSESLLVLTNFLVYGGICRLIRRHTIRKLPEFLERIEDSEQNSSTVLKLQPS